VSDAYAQFLQRAGLACRPGQHLDFMSTAEQLPYYRPADETCSAGYQGLHALDLLSNRILVLCFRTLGILPLSCRRRLSSSFAVQARATRVLRRNGSRASSGHGETWPLPWPPKSLVYGIEGGQEPKHESITIAILQRIRLGVRVVHGQAPASASVPILEGRAPEADAAAGKEGPAQRYTTAPKGEFLIPMEAAAGTLWA
jgi:hypothetical protein